MKVGVIANSGKSLDGGLLELRRALERAGIADPEWHEVPKSRKAPKAMRRLLDAKTELVFVWGGDGMLQRCIDVVAGSDVALAIVPAGTSNLLATNLGVPIDIEQAVEIGLEGERRRLDVGRFNGERFAVMAGSGMDATMIRNADGGLKERLGRAGYVWAGLKAVRSKSFGAEIEVDGVSWFRGDATSVLIGNVGELIGHVEVFEESRPDDGMLEVGVVTADGYTDWMRTVARTVIADAEASPFVQATKARSVKVKLDRKVLYELDGGDRTKVKSFKVKVEPAAVTLCVPGSRAMSIQDRTESAPVRQAKSAGEDVGQSTAFEVLARAGFAARGLIYGIIGVLALKLALGDGGKTTDQSGALKTIAHQPFGRFLLIAVAIGFAGYALWRFMHVFLGHGPEKSDSGFDRVGAFGSGIAYAFLCVLSIEILLGSAGSSSARTTKATGGALGWPGGTWIVGIAGAVLIGTALYQGYRGLTKDFLKDAKTGEMGSTTKRVYKWLAIFGHCARMVVFGLVGVFLIKAAVDYQPRKAVSLDGALAKLANQSYGHALLGVVAAGLIAFALYSFADVRYRKI